MMPIPVPAQFRIIAHRGASAYAPENTVPAFELALEMGVTEVELDVQLSADGTVIVCHDRTLAKYGHGERVVEEMTADELLALDMGAWFSPFHFSGTRMPTLESLLDTFGDRLIYHIELKGKAEELAAATAAIVRQHSLLNKSIFTSFDPVQLGRMRTALPEGRRGLLVDAIDAGALAQAGELELFQLCPRADLLTEGMVAAGHERVPEVRVWGVNGSPQEVLRLIRNTVDCGCDGMTLNWPDWVVKTG